MNARCAGRDPRLVWSTHAGGNPTASDRSAEHAHAADRCAREIGGILTAFVARSRRLMGRPFGGLFQTLTTLS